MQEQTETPPFQLKNIYTRELLKGYAELLQSIWPSFPVKSFVEAVFNEEWPSLELKQRTRHISQALRRHLPASYSEATDILVKSAEVLRGPSGDHMMFQYGFIADFVEAFGVPEPDISIPAMEAITRCTSAEFAVRPFLLKYPERMYQQMLDWAKHPSYSVRRLASEGFRTRLPWGMGVPAIKKDPSPILPVLEILKTDAAETVRRSVANSLNDIAKDFPELALELAQKWQGISAETDWVVRHGCRMLLKRGNPVALRLFGFEQADTQVAVRDFDCTKQVPVGGKLAFKFSLENTGAQTANLRVEYAIAYLTASGKISNKVFKIKELTLAPGEAVSFDKYQRFQDFTTRKHYPGAHRIAVLANGLEAAALDFVVTR